MTTCAVCDQSWTGLTIAHCSMCHTSYSGIGLFDRHRQHYGERGRCTDPAEVTDSHGDRVMWPDDKGVWRGTEDYHPSTPPKRT